MEGTALAAPTKEDCDREAELLNEQHKLRFGQTRETRQRAMEAIERLKKARSPAMLAYLSGDADASAS